MLAAGTRGSRRGSGAPEPDSAAARFEVLERVGEGTLFVVYRVRDRASNRVLALKALKDVFSRHQRFAAALAQAAERTLALNHPRLARLHELGAEDGTLFLVGEWLPGLSLETRLRRGPLPPDETFSLLRQIAEGLHYLHQNGALHGDLRPRQVLLAGPAGLKLTDAGLGGAYAATGVAPFDVQPDTVYYLAPERFEGAPPSVAADLYALGVTLYRMLAGRVPFDGPSPLAIAARHRHDLPLRPSQFNRHCPPELEAIALRLLEKDPQVRYQSAAQLLSDVAGDAGLDPAAPDEADDLAAPPAATPVMDAAPVASDELASTPPAPAVPQWDEPAPDVRSGGTAAADQFVASHRARPAVAHHAVARAADDYNAAVDDEHQERIRVKRHRRREAWGALWAFFWMLVAVGALGGILYGAYYFWMQEIPEQVAVPKYIGLNRYEAERVLSASGLKMRVVREIPDPKRPENTVLSGDPPPAKQVRSGREVLVTVSTGEEPIKMPNFNELTLARARQILAQNGMRLGQVMEQYHDKIPQGYICGQYPDPGEPTRRADPINLVVSKGSPPTGESTSPEELPPPPEPQADPQENPVDENVPTGPEEGTEETPGATSKMTMVSRAISVRVVIPDGAGRQEVRIIARDADGERTVYRRKHVPGQLVDKIVRVRRQQGATATVRVFLNGSLLREEQF